jgi:flagellar motor protein MotB
MRKRGRRILGGGRAVGKDESQVRWLISYSDFMMQLVCLFVLLYSVSSLDKGKTASELSHRIEEVPGGWRVTFHDVLFEAGSAELTARGGELLDGAAATLRAYAGQAEVTSAPEGDDLGLALARAESVVTRLTRHALDARFVTPFAGGVKREVTIMLRTE